MCAGVMLLAGLAMLPAVAAVWALPEDADFAPAAARTVVPVAVALCVAGLGAIFLIRSPPAILPGEQAHDAPPFGGWLLVVAAVLLVLPLFMVERLQPLIALWRDMLAMLDRHDVWNEAARAHEFSGIVLIPVFATLSVPLVQSAAAVSFAGGSVLLLLLLVVRSARFPNALVVCVLLQSALVVVSWFGADAVEMVADALHRELPADASRESMATAIDRYATVTRSTARILAATLSAYLIVTLVAIISGRAPHNGAVVQPQPRQGPFVAVGALLIGGLIAGLLAALVVYMLLR
jgi:hypothetical protein